jgi:NADPH-dependent 2,4-dienoyl-CoA reductase/sulfur reductase-like enzyme/pSer/pThr/pTyr-binding forkhead associated (FHA) protein
MAERIAYVIVGNGIAGVTAAEILRNEDSAADITVIADDPFPVYYRPALKDYLAGRIHEDKLWAKQKSFYEDNQIRFLSERVVSIQVGQHTVQLSRGQHIGYSRLLLANGASASTLKCAGLALKGVTTLRTIADYQQVLNQLPTVRRIVVSGSGTLALETIETLRHRGYAVTHLLRRRTLWSEVLDVTASDLVLQQEKRDGVDVHIEDEIAEIVGKQGQVNGVVTTSGARIACEMVIIAIGVEPIIGFIKSSGIPCGRGVQVDGAMRSNAPDIYAAGDVLETTSTFTGRTRVLGQWYPAVQQARAAAYSMLDLLDTTRPFQSSAFYNATFLYGLDFASVGLTTMPKEGREQYAEIVADPQPRRYRKVLLKNGVPIGMISLGDRKKALAFKRAIDHQVNLTSVATRLFAPDFRLSKWLDSQGVPPAMLGVQRKGDGATKVAAYSSGQLSTVLAKGASEAVFVPVAMKTLPSLREIQLSQTKVMTVGRQAGVFLLLDHGSISRRHAELRYANGQYVLHDMGSTNGTYLNDVQLAANSTTILKPNDRVSFGKDIAFMFQLRTVGNADEGDKLARTVAGRQQGTGNKAEQVRSGDLTMHSMKTGFFDLAALAQAKATKAAQPILNADGSLLLPGASSPIAATIVATLERSAALVVVAADGKPQVFLLAPGKRVTLGRDKKNTIVLADAAISRFHADVYQGPDGFYITDTDSSNGISVNHTQINNPYHLAHGDTIAIGGISIFFLAPGEADQAANLSRSGGQEIGAVTTSPGERVRPLRDGNKKVCPTCSMSNSPVARFCAQCGTPI